MSKVDEFVNMDMTVVEIDSTEEALKFINAMKVAANMVRNRGSFSEEETVVALEEAIAIGLRYEKRVMEEE